MPIVLNSCKWEYLKYKILDQKINGSCSLRTLGTFTPDSSWFCFLFFSSWNWASWRKTKSGVPLANLQATSPAESIHLWFVLQEKSNQQRYPELSLDLNKSLPYFFVFGVWYDLLWQHSIYYLLLLLFYTLYALQMHFAILLEYLWVLGHLYCDVETWQRKLIDKAFLLSAFSFKDDCFFFFLRPGF